MPKALLDDLEMHTGGHEHDGVGMAETVKGESHKPDAPAVDRKLFGDIVLRRRPFCFPPRGKTSADARHPFLSFISSQYAFWRRSTPTVPSSMVMVLRELAVFRFGDITSKKLALQMAMVTYTPASFYLSITLNELEEYADITAEINKH